MMARFDRYWRLLATGLSFALFGVGGLFLTVFVFPAYNLAIADPIKAITPACRACAVTASE